MSINWLKSLPGVRRRAPDPAGPQLYHYDRKNGSERARIHLRIDADGSGLMIVNASRVMHLNPTAAFMAHMALEGIPPENAARAVTRRYRITAEDALRDYTQTQRQVQELIRPDGACPIHDLNLEVAAPFSARPSAPYRMDLALTYRCNNDCAHCYNARPRLYPELTTVQWMSILDRVWRAGIPHVVFTGGEPTLRDDLPDLIAHAQHNGQIAGLNTNGRRLSDAKYLARLVDAGLDHVQITFESHEPKIHDQMVKSSGAWKQTVAGIRNALATRLYVMTNTTMLHPNAAYLEHTLDYLAELGVPTIGLNALIYSGKGAECGSGLDEKDLPALLDLARRRTEAHGQRLIWYTPTQYCNFDPVMMDLGVKGCTAALYNMCVEPDGAVIPCQSYYQPIGSLLNDDWDAIWNHSLAVDLRERRSLPDKCTGCLLLAECGGGCPLYRQATNGAKLQ